MTELAPRSALHHALTARVLARVHPYGIPHSDVEDAVQRVLETLQTRQAVHPPSFVAAVTARSLPDLASRLRRDLEREGVVIEDIGIGSAGQHTVVTLRLPDSARAPLERLAVDPRCTVSYLSGVD